MTSEQLKTWRLNQTGRSKRGKQHHGLSQREAADRLNVPLATYRNWEQGRVKVPALVDRIIKL